MKNTFKHTLIFFFKLYVKQVQSTLYNLNNHSTPKTQILMEAIAIVVERGHVCCSFLVKSIQCNVYLLNLKKQMPQRI